jgi:hypothetical protein
MDSLPFETIESAQQFVNLLIEAIEDSRKDVEADIAETRVNDNSRCRDALLLVAHQLNMLSSHLAKSSHILNDLRSLERLLYREGISVYRKDPDKAASTSHGIDW